VPYSWDMSALAAEPRSVPLTQLPRGGRATVDMSAVDHDDARVLRAMGLRPNAQVKVCRHGEPCIVKLSHCCGHGCRIGLSRRLAECVMVCPCE